MYCIKCGAIIKENALYCVRCGAKAVTYNSLNMGASQKATEPKAAQHCADERNKETDLRKNRKSRMIIMVCSISVFITGFLLYGYLGSGFLGKSAPLIAESVPEAFILAGFFGGLFLCGILTGIVLAVKFFKRRGLVFKIIASVLFPITILVFMEIGTFSCIPYQIYNLVKIIMLTKKIKQNSTDNV